MMRRFLSTRTSEIAFTLGTLILRLGMGILMIPHGFNKLQNFNKYVAGFVDPFYVTPAVSLGLTVFAELFCAALVVLGLLTRLACIPLIIAMCVALFVAHKGLLFTEGEHAGLYIVGYTALLLLGPGKASVDKLIFK